LGFVFFFSRQNKRPGGALKIHESTRAIKQIIK
jgi:hypothetical protein